MDKNNRNKIKLKLEKLRISYRVRVLIKRRQ